ncbi:cellulose binding domain-containing protein [Streptomyces scabiei]|uniref:cellulose binding domain-containing protein n=1 Tax=Streptomyces scabiei TaxID=1930 RepID=UPI003D1608DD
MVWQRSDSQETFYSCSDIVFDGGNGEVTGIKQPGNPSEPVPGTCSATRRTTGSWSGGYQSEVVVTNTGDVPMLGWMVDWTLPAGRSRQPLERQRDLQRTERDGAQRQLERALDPGKTATFGYVVQGREVIPRRPCPAGWAEGPAGPGLPAAGPGASPLPAPAEVRPAAPPPPASPCRRGRAVVVVRLRAVIEKTRVWRSQAKDSPERLSRVLQVPPSADAWRVQPVGASSRPAEVSVYRTAFVRAGTASGTVPADALVAEVSSNSAPSPRAASERAPDPVVLRDRHRAAFSPVPQRDGSGPWRTSACRPGRGASAAASRGPGPAVDLQPLDVHVPRAVLGASTTRSLPFSRWTSPW